MGCWGLVACPKIVWAYCLLWGDLFIKNNVAFSRAKPFHHTHVQLVQTLTQGLFKNIYLTKKYCI